MTRIKRKPGEKPRLPIIGKIKCGMKHPEKGYPMSVDHFIPTGRYAPLFQKHFGDKPKLLPVIFIEDGEAKQCEERYEYRDRSGSLYAYGDGEFFFVWNGKEYEMFLLEDHPDLMERVHQKVQAPKPWSVTLTLRFVIPGLPVVGLWQFTTKGEASTIPNIVGSFDAILEHNGTVKGILWDLSVAFAKSQKPGEKSRYPVVDLVPNNDPDRLEEVKTVLLNQGKLLTQSTPKKLQSYEPEETD